MSFLRLIRAEWTKFRSVRGWLVAAVVAALALVGLGLVSAVGSHAVRAGSGGAPRVLTGPDGEPVQDDLQFVHRTLTGDGDITARIASLTGDHTPMNAWAKAGLIMKDGAEPGSSYVAVMLTGGHGSRLQYDFTGDIAGPPAPPSDPRWLRLVRHGQTFTGYESADGTTWTEVGSARVPRLPATVEAGMFVTSPADQFYAQHLGGIEGDMSLTRATVVFDQVTLRGTVPSGVWAHDAVSGAPGDYRADGDRFTLSGTGNVAPNSPDGPGSLERTLVGTFAALTVLIVLAVLNMATEYRRGMSRTTFAAEPRRGRVLLAKAAVVGGVAFTVGLVASAAALPVTRSILVRNGNLIFPASTATEVRLVVGTAALLAVASVLALAVGTLMRRSTAAVAVVVVLTVLPYLLATAAVLPAVPAEWLLRVTPAAAFAIQQSVRAYPQVDNAYTPATGYFPLSPWVGFAVLVVWAGAALALAVHRVRRRDV